MNDRCFEDCERILKEIKSFFFIKKNTLYLWTAVYVSCLTISFSDFLFLFAPSLVLLIYSCVLRGTTTLLMIFADYLKKNLTIYIATGNEVTLKATLINVVGDGICGIEKHNKNSNYMLYTIR
jgi:hypothetical protein